MSRGRASPENALPAVLHIDLERGWRGGQQQVAYLIAHLRGLGVPGVLVCRPGEPLARWAAAAGVATVAVTGGPGGVWRLWRAVRRERIAVVHAHASRAHNLGLLLRLLCPSLRLVVSRRVDFPRRPGPLNRWKYTTPRVARWIAISRRVGEVLEAGGVPPARIAVIPSGIDPERIAAARPAPDARRRLREALGLGADDFAIGSVGALVPHKDPATLVEAFARLAPQRPRARLLIAGEGPERPRLERLIAGHGLEARAALLGHRADVPALLHACDLFALASREEGLGTSVLDAMAAGLPVVVTRAGGLPEMVADGRNGRVVPPQDPAALATALAGMVDDEDFRRACAAHNRADVERFAARRTAERTLALYREVLGAAPPVPS